ncbi:hypothetical protein Ddc_13225 [Ditylenchus destructor]|nr:hypothetical protein Ddc_13225 [Ditylenchus destructor]
MTHLKLLLLILFPIIVAAVPSIKSFGRYSPDFVKRYIESTYNGVKEYNQAVEATNKAVSFYDEAEEKLKQAQKSVNDALASEDTKRSDIEEGVDTVIALLKSTYLYPRELAAFEKIAKQIEEIRLKTQKSNTTPRTVPADLTVKPVTFDETVTWSSSEESLVWTPSITEAPQVTTRRLVRHQMDEKPRQLALLVSGELEHMEYFGQTSGLFMSRLASKNNSVMEDVLRLTGTIVCVDKDAYTDPEKQQVSQVKNSIGSVSFSSRRNVSKANDGNFDTHVSSDGFFMVRHTAPVGDEHFYYFTVSHNCTPKGTTTSSNFELSSFRGQQYKAMVDGLRFFSLSNDREFGRDLQKKTMEGAIGQINGFTKEMPREIHVHGEFSDMRYRIVGKIYNWDIHSMPEATPGKSLEDIPLHFDGKISEIRGHSFQLSAEVDDFLPDVEGSGFESMPEANCAGSMQISVLLNGREISKGFTHSDGNFHLRSMRGKSLLVETIDQDQLSLAIEHHCGHHESGHPQARVSERFHFKAEQSAFPAYANAVLIADRNNHE